MVPAVVDHSNGIVPIDVVTAVVVQIDFSPMCSGTITSRGACAVLSARLSGDW